MKGQAEFLLDTIGRLRAAGIPYMVAGSLASSFHGEPRATQDIDVVIDPKLGPFQRFLGALGDSDENHTQLDMGHFARTAQN